MVTGAHASGLWPIVYRFTGVGGRGQPNTAYSFWSGIAGELGFPAAIAVWWRHNNCHAPRCWRLGRHPTADGTYRLCAAHHPDVPDALTLEDIHEAHREATTE